MTSSLSAGRLAPHGGSGFQGMGMQTGASGAPGILSGAVMGAAATAGRLDRQAHEVIVPVNPHLQLAAPANAEQLVTFAATPICAYRSRVARGAEAGWSDENVRNGHERLLC